MGNTRARVQPIYRQILTYATLPATSILLLLFAFYLNTSMSVPHMKRRPYIIRIYTDCMIGKSFTKVLHTYRYIVQYIIVYSIQYTNRDIRKKYFFPSRERAKSRRIFVASDFITLVNCLRYSKSFPHFFPPLLFSFLPAMLSLKTVVKYVRCRECMSQTTTSTRVWREKYHSQVIAKITSDSTYNSSPPPPPPRQMGRKFSVRQVFEFFAS